VIVALGVWMALPLAGGDAYLADNEARDLPAIADYLRHELRPGDAVLIPAAASAWAQRLWHCA
jgi:hypothetical protein